MLNIRVQLLAVAILVSATCTVSAQNADPTSPSAAAPTETAGPKADAIKTEIAGAKADAVKKVDVVAKKPRVVAPTWRCELASIFSWFQTPSSACSSASRAGLVLGVAY